MSSLYRQSNGGCDVDGIEFSKQSSVADTPYSGTYLPTYVAVCYPRSIIIIIIIIIIITITYYLKSLLLKCRRYVPYISRK
jgi:hypothetical protein